MIVGVLLCSSHTSANITCFTCGGKGHKAAVCGNDANLWHNDQEYYDKQHHGYKRGIQQKRQQRGLSQCFSEYNNNIYDCPNKRVCYDYVDSDCY